MSFDIVLTVPGLTEQQARQVSALADERGAWPIGWRGTRRVNGLSNGPEPASEQAAVWFPQATEAGWSLTGDDAVVDGVWEIEPRLAARLAASIKLLGEELRQGFTFDAHWVTDELEREVRLTSLELAALARSSRIQERTRYVVPASGTTPVSQTPPAAAHEDCEFGAPGALRDRLVAAVLRGEKTATSSLLAQYFGERLPSVGQQLRVVDSGGAAVGIIEITEVAVVRMREIDQSLAIDEGEGFETIEDWRGAHERFWRDDPDVTSLGIVLSDETLVVAERFRLIT